MFYLIRNRDDLEKMNELASLQSQLEALRLQDEIRKQNFLGDMQNVLNPSLIQLKMSLKM